MPNIKIPESIASYLEYKDCSNFDVSNYFLLEDVKNLLKQVINKQKIAGIMHGLGREAFNSTLLYSKPGTGKTLSCQYIAYKMGVDYFYMNYAKLMEAGAKYAGKKLCEIFEFMAKQNCVFMLDEIDYIATKRSSESDGNVELSQLTITLMQELDYLRNCRSDVVLIAATNRKDRLDKALLTRFSIKYEMKQVTVYEKTDFIKRQLRSVNKRAGEMGLPLVEIEDSDIQKYCSTTPGVTLREINQDVDTALSKWITSKFEFFELIHYDETT